MIQLGSFPTSRRMMMRTMLLSMMLLIQTTTLPTAVAAFSSTASILRQHRSIIRPLQGEETGWGSFSKADKSNNNDNNNNNKSNNNNNRPFKDLPPGEAQRQYRRTVYTHKDWRKHRSQDRFIYYLAAIFQSGVYKNIGREVFTVTAVAAVLCLYNAAAAGYTDLDGVVQPALLSSRFFPVLTIPLTAFTVTSSSLGLLLVFRTNTSYRRWDEARKNWGSNINRTRDLVRLANTYYDSTGIPSEQRQADLHHVALCTWAFVRCMKRHLSPDDQDEAAFQQELHDKLPAPQADAILQAAHRPNRALQDLSFAIDDLPMHFLRKNQIHNDVTQFEDNLGSSERLLTSPVPLFYSRHLARFLATWLLFLPLGLYEPFATSWNHVVLIPATFVIAVFLVGIEELGTQLEEPFTILPMQAFCDKIYNWCMEIVSWTPGDNGRQVRPPRADHAFFTTDSLLAVDDDDYDYDQYDALLYNNTQVHYPQPNDNDNDNTHHAVQQQPAAHDNHSPSTQSLDMADFLRQQGQGKHV